MIQEYKRHYKKQLQIRIMSIQKANQKYLMKMSHWLKNKKKNKRKNYRRRQIGKKKRKANKK